MFVYGCTSASILLSHEKMIPRTMKKPVRLRDHGDAVDVVEGTAMF